MSDIKPSTVSCRNCRKRIFTKDALEVEDKFFCEDCYNVYEERNKKEASALDVQVGGSHYKNFKIQPIEYIHANNMNFADGCIVKYISRHKNKNGIEDIKKTIHFAKIIAKLEYGEDL